MEYGHDELSETEECVMHDGIVGALEIKDNLMGTGILNICGSCQLHLSGKLS